MTIFIIVLLFVLGFGTWLSELDPAFIALFCTFVGGAGLKIVEKWLSKNAEKRDDRKSYREEIQELQDRLDKVEASLEDTRAKYYEAQEQVLRLKARMLAEGINPETPMPH